MENSTKVMIKNVRLSYPNLFAHEDYQGDSTGKFSATFLLHKEKNKEDIKRLKDMIQKVIIASGKVKKLPADKIALKDGDDKEGDEYQDHMYIKATTKRRPTVLDRNKTPLVDEDGVLYAGCYVNAIVDFWFQDNKFGKRVNSNLLGVQFSKDGDALGSGAVDVTDDFSEVTDDDEF